jgi:hypothetical protein
VTDLDTQELRAIASALWPHLQRGRWNREHARDLDDYGDRPPYRSICTATIPNAARAYSQHVISEPLAIVATLHDGSHAILTAEAYERAYLALTSDEQRAHYASLMGKRPAPYRLTTARGERYWRNTEYGWDAMWAPAARRAVLSIALAAGLATRRGRAGAVSDANCPIVARA